MRRNLLLLVASTTQALTGGELALRLLGTPRWHAGAFASEETAERLRRGGPSTNVELLGRLEARGVIDAFLSLSQAAAEEGTDLTAFRCRWGTHYAPAGCEWAARRIADKLP